VEEIDDGQHSTQLLRLEEEEDKLTFAKTPSGFCLIAPEFLTSKR
jgi:hypothetical protein